MMGPQPDKPRYPLAAAVPMLEAGAKFVICDYWGQNRRDGQQSKKALHKGYAENRPPGFNLVKKHIDQDGLLGLMPESLGLAVLDVDRGDATILMTEFPLFLPARSNRPGRLHLFYRNPQGLRFPRKWSGPGGTSGELVQGTQYVILWNDTLRDLAEALHDPMNRGGVDFGQVASALRWATPERQGKPQDRILPDTAPDLARSNHGSRNTDNFDSLRFWAYSNYQQFDTREEFHAELEGRALAGRDSMPDVGPGPTGDNEYTVTEALATAASVAEGVWGWFVTKERQYSRNPENRPISGNSGALRADSRPDSRGGQSWESWEMENPQHTRHSARCHHKPGEPCRGNPALNHDSEEQRRRRACKTEEDHRRVTHRQKAAARRFVLGDDVGKLAQVFDTSRRTIQRDLAEVTRRGELPSRREARRTAQAQQQRRQREGNPPGREGGTGLNVSGQRVIEGEERQETDRAGPSFSPLHPPGKKDAASGYYSTEGGLTAPPRDNGLMSPPREPGSGGPGEGLSNGH